MPTESPPLLAAVRGHLARLCVAETASEPSPGVIRLTDGWTGASADYDGARLAEALAGISWPNREPPKDRDRYDAGHVFWEGADQQGGFWRRIDHARLRRTP